MPLALNADGNGIPLTISKPGLPVESTRLELRRARRDDARTELAFIRRYGNDENISETKEESLSETYRS